MNVTEENYFSSEVNMEYCSNSQYKSFFGGGGIVGCQHKAIAELKCDLIKEPSDSMLLGSYVDCALTEPELLPKFMEDHPEMFSSRGATKGELKSQFKKGNIMIERVKREPLLMKMLDGEHQKIMVGEICGVPFRIKMDAYQEGKAIVDLKTTADIRKGIYDPHSGRKMNFMEFYGYDIQASIYQEIVRQNTGKKLPFFIVAVESKEHPLVGAFQIDQQSMDEALERIKENVELIPLLKSGEVDPIPCGECEYCADTLPVTEIQDWLSREDGDEE